MAAHDGTQVDPQRFKRLPPPVRREQLRTSEESRTFTEEDNDRLRETEWMLRVSAG